MGGKILDDALAVCKNYARVVVCGRISDFTEENYMLKNWQKILTNKLTVKGFLILDY